MKTLYRILRKFAPKNSISSIQNQKIKQNILKSRLHADKTISLLSQMYAAENGNLFI